MLLLMGASLNHCQSYQVSHIRAIVSLVPRPGYEARPLLFICYINDVTAVISSGSEINLFADDIVLYRIITCPSDFVHNFATGY